MKTKLLSILLLMSLIGFGQGGETVIKKPSFKITYDKFDNIYNYNAETGNVGIYATGTANDFTGITYQVFTLTVYDSYLTYASGIILLFSDGTKMNLETEEELGENAGKGFWKYYVFAHPNPDQWRELSNKIIVGYKFHIFERNYKNGNQFKTLVNNFYKEDY
jgi:hypothetical protein